MSPASIAQSSMITLKHNGSASKHIALCSCNSRVVVKKHLSTRPQVGFPPSRGWGNPAEGFGGCKTPHGAGRHRGRERGLVVLLEITICSAG